MTRLQIITVLFAGIIGLPPSSGALAANPAFLAVIACYMDELAPLSAAQISNISAAISTAAYSIANQGVPVDAAVSRATSGLSAGADFVEAVLRTGAV